jgi:protein O-GlcNAc transferase
MKRPVRKQFQVSVAPHLTVLGLAVLALSACTGGGDDSAEAIPTATTATGSRGPGRAEEPGGPGASGAQNALRIFEGGQMLAAQGDPEGARDEYRRAVQLDPDLAEAHFELGKLLVQMSYVTATAGRDKGVLAEGIDELQRAAEQRPADADYAYWTGRALSLVDRNEEARQWLERAIELDEEHGQALKRLAMVSAEESDNEAAKDCLRRAMNYLPEDGGVPFQLGNLLETESDFEGARDAYRKAIEIDHTMPGPYLKLAGVLARLGDEDGAAQAEQNFERWDNVDKQLKQRVIAANQKPDDAPTLVAVGEMYFALKKWEDAEAWFSRALTIDPSSAKAHLYRGIVMRHLGEYELAMNHLLEASFFAPDSFEPHLELIRVYVLMEDEAQLTEKLAEVDAELKPEFVEERLVIADVLLEMGRSADAQARYESILETSPENEAAKAGLARANGE